MAGLEARLTLRGAGRWGGVAFLSFWLCFWAVGEALVLWLLVAGGWALATGQPLGRGPAPVETVPALLTGLFLIVWVSFWTFGGIAAWYELFRLIWSTDRILVRGDGIELERRVGPLTKRTFLPRDQLRGIHRLMSGSKVQAEMTAKVIELTRNGTPAEQDELVKALIAELQLPADEKLAPSLPDEWRAVPALEGGEVLVRNPATRRTQARIMWIIALPFAWIALTVLREAWTRPNYGVIAAMLTVAAGFAVWAAVRLTWARDEWRIEPGRLVLQRRFCSRAKEKFTGTTLRLMESRDSDGDEWFKLEAVDAAGAARKLQNAMHDPLTTRRLGQWLAARTGISFADGAAPEIRARLAAERTEAQARMQQQLKEWWSDFLRRLPGMGRGRER